MKTNNDDGYYAIGIYKGKTEHNIGTLWRSAYIMGAKYIFTIGKRYKKQSSDTMITWSRIPLFHYDTMEDFMQNIPYDCRVIGIEMTEDATFLSEFTHPKRSIYILGAEDGGLPDSVIEKCHFMVKLPGNSSLNVGVTGSIICHDRISKLPIDLPPNHTEKH